MSHLITFPPTLLLMLLFRKSKRRGSELQRLRKSLNLPKVKHQISKEKQLTNEKKEFLLPWWCKIIAIILAFSAICVSLVFIVFKGLELGDILVKKWLTSFLTQFFTATFLQEPIKIVLTIISYFSIYKFNFKSE